MNEPYVPLLPSYANNSTMNRAPLPPFSSEFMNEPCMNPLPPSFTPTTHERAMYPHPPLLLR